MSTFLFDEIIFGPVRSRRLGISLGINLLPTDKKWCNFDCLYCECGLNTGARVSKSDLPSVEEVRDGLQKKISEMGNAGSVPDVITFAGNGEPTIHPDFPEIIDLTIEIRNKLCPKARIAVLTNSTTIHQGKIRKALKKVDQNILKLDTAIESSFRSINRPSGARTVNEYISTLADFGKGVILQTLFFRGEYQGAYIDNTTETEITALINAYKKISPEYVMIYSFERDTPVNTLKKLSREELDQIAIQVRKAGINCEVSS